MKIYQIIKKVNNTELGKGNTHDCYVRIPNDIDGEIIFNKGQNLINFINKRNKKKIEVSYTTGREQRFNKLGEFYRENNLIAGDEVIFERRFDEKDEYYIDFIHYSQKIILQKKFKKGFSLLYGDIINILDQYQYFGKIIKIKSLGKFKPRKDSPKEIELYDFLISGESQIDNYRSGDMVEIRINEDNEIEITLIETSALYIMEV